MGELVLKLPDVGEGIAEAELVEWHVKIGDLVREDAPLAAVMTDKATVEIPSPAEGEVVWLGAEVGDRIAVGAGLVRLRTPAQERVTATATAREPPMAAAGAAGHTGSGAGARPSAASRNEPPPAAIRPPEAVPSQPVESARHSAAAPHEGGKPVASPAVRLRARDAGVDLRQVHGTGPAGRITYEDLDAFLARGSRTAPVQAMQARTSVEDIKLVGLRRKVAEKMSAANTHIPHITYVEEVDVTALEELRAKLNLEKRQDAPKLTLLPFLMRALVRAIAGQPHLNALFDDEAGVLHQHAGVHIGIAAQTPAGLMVPVVKHAEALDLWACAAELNRLAEAARAGTATRGELSGSTITVTSLGSLGGFVSTPIINYPEVAIVGVNKITMRPVWNGAEFVPRKIMNLSSSFDHRVVDGWDAAHFVQRIKALLETPALIFVNG
ncbi:MAG: dihydrolipoamide acetyltransferase family protein [Rhodomicrobium sp.]